MHAHSHLCSSYTTPSAQPSLGASNQNVRTDDEEGWTLVTYKKTRKPKPQATTPRVEQWRKHQRRNNRKPKKDVKVAKLTYAREPMEQEPLIPEGKAIVVKQEKTCTSKQGLPTYFSIEEALQLLKEMQISLVAVLASLDDHKVQESKDEGLKL
ncbi:hypothetical protein ACFX2F_028177 [Malus domestica]